MAKPHTFLDFFRVYDKAVYNHAGLLSVSYGSIGQYKDQRIPILRVIAGVSRAFSEMREVLVRKGFISPTVAPGTDGTSGGQDSYKTVPLPFLSIDRRDVEIDLRRTMAVGASLLGKLKLGGYAIFEPPKAYKIVYELNYWTDTKFTQAYIQEWWMAQIGRRGRDNDELMMYAAFAPPFPINLCAPAKVTFQNLDEVEPGTDGVLHRFVVNLEVMAWMVCMPGGVEELTRFRQFSSGQTELEQTLGEYRMVGDFRANYTGDIPRAWQDVQELPATPQTGTVRPQKGGIPGEGDLPMDETGLVTVRGDDIIKGETTITDGEASQVDGEPKTKRELPKIDRTVGEVQTTTGTYDNYDFEGEIGPFLFTPNMHYFNKWDIYAIPGATRIKVGRYIVKFKAGQGLKKDKLNKAIYVENNDILELEYFPGEDDVFLGYKRFTLVEGLKYEITGKIVAESPGSMQIVGIDNEVIWAKDLLVGDNEIKAEFIPTESALIMIRLHLVSHSVVESFGIRVSRV